MKKEIPRLYPDVAVVLIVVTGIVVVVVFMIVTGIVVTAVVVAIVVTGGLIVKDAVAIAWVSGTAAVIV